MIQAEVFRGEEMIMARTFYERNLTLELALKNVEMYVVQEGLNMPGECKINVKYLNLEKAK